MKKRKFNIQEILISVNNPKIRQKMKLLIVNRKFLKDIVSFKKRWNSLIRKYNSIIRATNKKFPPKLLLEYIEGKKQMSDATIRAYFSPLHRAGDLIMNSDIDNEILNITKKYKLFPLYLWRLEIKFFIFNGFFGPSGGYVLSDYKLFRNEGLPLDTNFGVRIVKNPETGETEILLHIYDDTTEQDIKKYWKYINQYQKTLRNLRGKKRYYPLKNLDKIKKLFKEDKKKSITYTNPIEVKIVKEKNTDLKKIYKIYENIPFKKDAEYKAINRLKQMRHQYKKRMRD